MDIMKCNECGFENKDTAKFCSKCGNPIGKPPVPENNNSKIIIAALAIIIVILAVSIGYFALTNGNGFGSSVQSTSGSADVNNGNSGQSSPAASSSQPKEWKLIGTYSGSGSGTKTVNVPPGQIMIKISAYPIKNYATNHLYVNGPSGQSVGVDWGPTSDVETRSDSITLNLSTQQAFTIDFYETVNWQVEFYRYQ